jgi:hypothetical protein
MRIPYVIDNQTHRMADILNALLAEHKGRSLDVATAYFNIQGFRLVHTGLEGLGNLRLLLGAEPRTGEQVDLRPDVKGLVASIRGDLEGEPFTSVHDALEAERPKRGMRCLRPLTSILVNLAILGLAMAAHAATPRSLVARVDRISDGDTAIATSANGTKLRIRLLGIDAPEIPRGRKPGQSHGEEARDYLDHLVGGETLRGMCGPQLVAH